MNWMEFYCDEIICPHCGEYVNASFEVNSLEADRESVTSSYFATHCDECYEEFYFKCRVNFEVDFVSSSKENPMPRKKK